MHRALVLVVLVGCGQEYGFATQVDRPVATSVVPLVPEVVLPPPTPAGVELHTQRLQLGGDAPSEVADYLFVVDGSSSMERVLGRVLDGFQALADSEVFPSQARIAVMSTLPADPAHRGRVHSAAPRSAWLRHDPGFGGLVDGDRIALFRELAPPEVADRFAVDGCNAWFAPGDRNAQGVPCLVANTQLSLYPVIVEAGLTALGQRLEGARPLFRTGAATNVIFVSDTHDPGVPEKNRHFEALQRIRPTFGELEQLAMSRQELASFRLHAIAPAAVCTSEDWTASGPAYFDAALESGGEILDLCGAEPDAYVELVRRIAVGGAIRQRPVIALEPDAEVSEILVDGAPARFTVSPDGLAAVLAGGLPDRARDVQVRYRVVPSPRYERRTPVGPSVPPHLRPQVVDEPPVRREATPRTP